MPVRWSSLAQADFRAFYERALEKGASYAVNITEALKAAITRLPAFPQLGTSIGSAGHRKWRLRKTPFLMIYTTDTESLHTLRAYHERQDWGMEP